MSAELNAAYAVCRRIARTQAKNFYYAFLALPKHKSDAMCAIYAFMRKADDLADDESIPVADRRVQMQQWLASWHQASERGATADPIFLAVFDTQRRFGISNDLLGQLVRGTTMDLETSVGGVEEITVDGETFQAYRTFDDLYRYCYLVASVVGLVCIRIFGYRDRRAELLAEHTGIAFQLTNILRDVKEDTERHRIYLPLDDLRAHGGDADDVSRLDASLRVLNTLQQEIDRARKYYESADALIPLLDRDSRAAMTVLAAIYRDLLERIAADPSEVLRSRVSVPTSRKVRLLAGGMAASLYNRITTS